MRTGFSLSSISGGFPSSHPTYIFHSLTRPSSPALSVVSDGRVECGGVRDELADGSPGLHVNGLGCFRTLRALARRCRAGFERPGGRLCGGRPIFAVLPILCLCGGLD